MTLEIEQGSHRLNRINQVNLIPSIDGEIFGDDMCCRTKITI